jgi:DNA-binding IclR family transcriptional regulator
MEQNVVVATASYTIESVENAVRVLLMLRSQRSLAVSDVARQLGIARSSAHRMLATLHSEGMVELDPATRQYGAGPQLIELGLAVLGSTDLRSQARPYLELLVDKIGETVHLLVPDRNEVVFLDGVEGRHAIRAALRTGDRAPAHVAGAGKLFLAQLSEAQLLELYPNSQLRGGTTNATRSLRSLQQKLADVRRDGYALNLEESEPGLNALAVPVRASDGSVRAAFSIAGPASRLTESALLARLPIAQDLAGQLGARLT